MNILNQTKVLFSVVLLLTISCKPRSGANLSETGSKVETHLVGEYFKIQHGGYVYSIDFSSDGRFVVTASSDPTAQIRGLSKNEMIATIGHRGSVNSAQFSPNNQYVVTASWDMTAKIFDLNKKEVIATIEHRSNVYSAQFSPNNQYVVTASQDKTAKIFDLNRKEVIATIEHSGPVKSAQFSPNNQYVVTASQDKTAKIFDLNKKEVIATIEHSGPVKSAQFSPNNQYVVTASEDKTAKIFDLNKKEVIATIEHGSRVRSAQFSPNNQYIVTASSDKTAKIFDLNKKEVIATIEHGSTVLSAQFSPNNQYVVTASDDHTANIFDLNKMDVIANIEHEHWVNFAKFSPNGKYVGTASYDTTAKIIEFKLASAAPIPPPLEKLALQCSGSRIHDLQKNFDPQKDLGIILGMAGDPKFAEINPEIMNGIFSKALETSPYLYEELTMRSTMKTLKPTKLLCPSNAGKAKAIAYAKSLIPEDLDTRVVNPNFNGLFPLAHYFSQLSESERSKLLDGVTYALSGAFSDTPGGASIFRSKVHKIIKQRFKPVFGFTGHEVTDLSLVQTSNGFDVYALGNKQINDQKINNFGFFSVKLDSIPIDGSVSNIDTSREWMHENKKWSAKIKISVSAVEQLVNTSPTPPYEQFMKDGKITGLIVIGSNVGVDYGNHVFSNITKYYTARGYKLKQVVNIPNLPSFVQSQIREEKIDYFLKEAHSDGDEKNLFRVNTTGKITNLTKENGDEVSIFVGDENSPTQLISNNEFGEAIASRGISLIYFNTSCWSKNKAIFEIQASGPKLIDICSKTTVSFFRDKDATSQMMDQFLDRKTYADMREAMKTDKGYAEQSNNYFIFPDTDEYKENVINSIRFHTKVDYQLINPEGKETNIDELDHQINPGAK